MKCLQTKKHYGCIVCRWGMYQNAPLYSDTVDANEKGQDNSSNWVVADKHPTEVFASGVMKGTRRQE